MTTSSSSSSSSSSTTSSTTSTSSLLLQPGTAVLDKPWEDLGFEYRPTRSHGRIVYRNGAWGELELIRDEPYIQLHIGATALHYGQTCFEGLKAFCHEGNNNDNDVYLFRPDENAARMQASCRRIVMPELSTDRFIDACRSVVRDNLDYVPPYGSNGALYIRPILFGSSPRIGLQPAEEYTFLLIVIPVGDYYKGGLSTSGVHGLILDHYDRAAPRGVGHVKVGGNYAADLEPNMDAKHRGYPICLYLDATTQSYIEEFSTSNFVGIQHATQTYVTPQSSSVLPSITNKSLMTLAQDVLGYTVETRPVALDELQQMDEVLAVGTAVVVTPVASLTRWPQIQGGGGGSDDTTTPTVYQFGNAKTTNENDDDSNKGSSSTNGAIGPVTLQLYNHIRAIQNGQIEDTYGWNVKV